MIVCILYSVIYVPYNIAFVEVTLHSVIIFEILVDLFFALDIFLMFFSEYEDPKSGEHVTNFKLIARNYLRGSFFFDILAAIPFSIIDLVTETN